IGCHLFSFVNKNDVLKEATQGATFLLNSPYGPDEVWDQLPRQVQEQIIEKEIDFWVVDGYRVASDAGLGRRISTVMQTCFFAIAGMLPKDEAIKKIKEAIHRTFIRKGEKIVEMNYAAVDGALANLHRVVVPGQV
ncbi:MAG: pyruvate:ferredoxin (flavodoxin) oxidoreductase, partial [Woeseiaceae bacterium]|nr:pyruvate:ferredoxin (flavodoxin) oxidoreductase [Woeseiaceae bacterium]NIP21443.1 pyruvate:ferredoxin (flavodoxin) oxidoreductase [Woeseiaceae bacterium]